MNLDALISNDYTDTALNKKSYKEKFFNLLAKNGFDFSDIDDATHLPKSLLPVMANDTEPFNKFNICLSNLNKDKEVNILDAVCFLVSDYLDAPIALKCLDEMNFIAVKNELQKRFKIKSQEKGQDFSLLDYLG
jgi:hypothetical protein